MKHPGLTAKQVEESRQQHGANTLTQIPPDPLWKKILEGFKDPMIMILLVALVVQVVLFFLGQSEWFEPVGILVAILIANGVASISENKQEGKASALKEEEEAKEMAKVLRDGKLQEIHVSEVVVGDIVYLQAGDKIPADGIVIEGAIKVDQAALNGETEEADKITLPADTDYDIKDLLNKYYAYRGTVGEIRISVKLCEGRLVQVEIADHGCGIADVKQAREPLFTTDAEGERSGMGFTVMESFCDSVKVRSRVDRGTTVVLLKRLHK